MALLLQNKIYDPIRKKWVSATPEELVRQQWIQVMTKELGFPAMSIAVEKSLKEIPAIFVNNQTTAKKIPNRRFDLICFYQVEESLRPLLVLEFKSNPLSEEVFDQVIGYNFHIKAKFVGIANHNMIKIGFQSKTANVYESINYLPTYQELKTWM